MTRFFTSTVIGFVGIVLLVAVPLADFSPRFFTTWSLFVHGIIFTGVGVRALAPFVHNNHSVFLRFVCDWLLSEYPYVFIDGGATLAFAVAFTIVFVLEEKHDYIFGEVSSCARVFSGHFAAHFAPVRFSICFFTYSFFCIVHLF